MQKFETPDPITTVLEIPAGRISLLASDRAETTVQVRPADAAKGRDVKAAEQTTVAYGDGVLRVIAPEAKNQVLSGLGSVEVTVHLPSGSGVEATSAAAEVRTEGRLGDVSVHGAHRRIEIADVEGLRLTAVDGDVHVGRLGGSAEISTARGGITVGEATRGTVVLRTQHGDISIAAAPGSSATLDADARHGRVSNALKNDGSPVLDIRATSGNGDIAARSL
ncbi:DUF4097 family beta strand repeat-containing protein [Streptomyces sp. NBC_00572]|uniref:DUF4097 family beta strand repeat-containing protein n=1 Tax=Streptomyces sp. NBC_00572 TaxID=2903664 RepID=UPI002253CD08|nr:DUF4097 family beta strand repeat-containing protein [Streptomyces sp. NBC_00572]MCX4986054.1 DUF4097 family beta strand repeat-containing protein [Streptomyces sp. NBC_00572]